MKYLLILFSFLIITSCSPERRIQRILGHHPELLVKDTLTISDTTYIASESKDTTFFWKSEIDTFLMDTGRVHIKIFRDHDTLRIHGECDSIIVYKTIQVPYNQVVITQSFWFRYGNLLMFILVCLIFYLLVRKMSK